MNEPRFYIVDIDTSHYLYQWMPGWYGVVDDNEGGIVAYFKDEDSATQYLENLDQT